MRNALVASLAAWIVAASSGCTGSGQTANAAIEKDKKPAEVVIPVQAEKPVRGSISSYFETSARVEAERKVDVTAEAPGTCLAVFKEEGDTVTAGEVLAELDKQEAEASYKQSEVQVRKSKADFERAKELAKEGLMSSEQYDAVRFQYEQGVASLNMQRVQLEKMTIRAPISGIITRRNIQKGQLVTTGTPAYSVVDPDSYTLTINPPEKDLQRLHLDQSAVVTIDALANQEFEAHVRRINPAVDPVSGTIKVVLDFDKEARRQLRDAAFARVKLVLETKNDVLTVPKDAIVEENARRYVFLVEERGASEAGLTGSEPEVPKPVLDGPRLIAKRVEVQTGFEDSTRVEIVSGVDDDDRVVTLGQFNLKTDSPVRMTSIDAEMAANEELSLDEALKRGQEKRGENPEVMMGGRRRR